MEKTTRRNLLRAVAAGGAAATGIGVALRAGVSTNLAADNGHSHGHHNRPQDGPMVNATVTFGSWSTDLPVPLDRFPNVPPAPPTNVHLLLPYEAKIKAGGSVNFLISGLHNIQIFADGIEPGDINTSLVTPMTGPPGLPIINDPANRIYRGPDPSLLPLDRVEMVNFAEPGRYLVICGFLLHFNDGMYGYVRVLK